MDINLGRIQAIVGCQDILQEMITGTLGDNTTEIIIEVTRETITEMITETMMDNIIGVDTIRTNVAMMLKNFQ